MFTLMVATQAQKAWASFNEDYFDIAGIKGAYGLYQTELQDSADEYEGFSYGAGLFYDRQLNGYLTLSSSFEYYYREYEWANAPEGVETSAENHEFYYATMMLKYFPIGDLWLGAGPTGYLYPPDQHSDSDLGVAGAVGYNIWLTWRAVNDFGQEYINAIILTPEIKFSYNLTNQNKTQRQWDLLFYFGIGTRAYRPEFY
jgi:hypothetical protein